MGMRLRRIWPAVMGNRGPVYLLRDEFTTADDAPVTTPRTCEPGPGQWTIVDTGNNLSIASGRLAFGGVAGANNPNLISVDGFAMDAGCALMATLYTTGDSARGRVTNGFRENATSAIPRYGWYDASATIRAYDGEVAVGSDLIPTNVVQQTMFVGTIMRQGGGAFYVVRVPSLADEYRLWWVGVAAVGAATQYARISCRVSGSPAYDRVAVASLASPWNTAYGIATQRLAGARAPGDTFTHVADALIEATVTTVPAADQIELRFRVQDATNYWQVTVDSTGALDLDEVVAGGVTQRGTAAGVIANGDRIVIIAVGTTITVFEANTLRITYTSAANFATATAGELETEGTGGSVTEIVSWPRTLSGAALAELERYTA